MCTSENIGKESKCEWIMCNCFFSTLPFLGLKQRENGLNGPEELIVSLSAQFARQNCISCKEEGNCLYGIVTEAKMQGCIVT